MENPQAFPRPHSDNMAAPAYAQDGMTLRDYFAAKAMTAIIESIYNPNGDMDEDEKCRETKFICERAYWHADAMLKQREL